MIKKRHIQLLTKLMVWVFFLGSFLWMSKAVFLGYYPDFITQYTVPQLMFSGQNPYVSGEGLYTTQVYPPLMALLYWPISMVPLPLAGSIFTIVSIAALVASLVLLSKIFDVSFFSTDSLLLGALVFLSFPVKFTLGMGQVNLFILLLLVISLWFLKKGQEYKSGIFLGLSIVIKLFPLFLPLYFFLKIKKIPHEFQDKFHWSGLFKVRIFNTRIWVWPSQLNGNIRLLLGIVSVVALSVFLILLFIPLEFTTYFVFTILPGLASSWKLDYYNQALSGLIGRSFGMEGVAIVLKFILSGTLSLLALFVVSKNEKMDFLTVSLKFGLLIAVSLMINTFSWQHHYVWMIVPFYATYFYIREHHLSFKYIVLIVISYFLIATNFKNPYVLPVLIQSHVLYGVLILYFLNLYLLIRFDRRGE